MDENDEVCHLLLTMPEEYDIVITALETMTTNLSLEFFKARLSDAELKLKNSIRDRSTHSPRNEGTFKEND